MGRLWQLGKKSQKKIIDTPTSLPHIETVTTKITIKLSPKGKIYQRQAAKILHVSPEHLNRVINGKVSSPRLMSLYRELVAKHQSRPQNQ